MLAVGLACGWYSQWHIGTARLRIQDEYWEKFFQVVANSDREASKQLEAKYKKQTREQLTRLEAENKKLRSENKMLKAELEKSP